MSLYLRPESLADALAALRARPFEVLSGGTDFYPARAGAMRDEDVLDVSAIADLRGIVEQDAGWRIGAATPWSEIRDAVHPGFPAALREAAREIGGEQIQNAGTPGGNLCHASPAADGVAALLALDARVELRNADGVRELGVSEFVTGARRTARAGDELLTAIIVPRPAAVRSASRFLKLGSRRYLVISFVMAAGALELDARGSIRQARVVVGACSPVAMRLSGLERDLAGCRAADAASLVTAKHCAGLAPIDDVRADAVYRREAAVTLVRRLLADLGASFA